MTVTAGDAIHDPAHEHPSELAYVKVAALLAAITGAEVALPYITDIEGPFIALMLVLMTVKFSIVALWFMHLRFDSLLFRRLFVAGIVLAVGVYMAVIVSMQFFGDDTTTVPLDERPPPPAVSG